MGWNGILATTENHSSQGDRNLGNLEILMKYQKVLMKYHEVPII
jgi:hypothetical protein